MPNPALFAISPIDGRYASKTVDLQAYFSEFALMRYRLLIEVEYLIALHALDLPQLQGVKIEQLIALRQVYEQFSEQDAENIKQIERSTNHDVKAIEYFLKAQLQAAGLEEVLELVHFGLTSQDINNTAIPLSLKEGLKDVFYPQLEQLVNQLAALAQEWMEVPMLAKTHGQPASPTLLGKELAVWVVRLQEQSRQVQQIPFSAKFGGATGNFNAHYLTYPAYDWHGFAQQFVNHTLGLQRSYPTTQIDHYDNLAAIFHGFCRINTILIDLCRDIWAYISMDYFGQQTVAGEVGSSAMPHKVNPIDFENAEGNLGISNALFEHLASKLPISRLQRDLTDSTVLRNLGIPIAHSLLAVQAIQKGLGKLLLRKEKLAADLEANWMVVAEGIQNVLRREGYPAPYEALKALTRGKEKVGEQSIRDFIHSLAVSDAIKAELLAIRPENYVGRFVQ